MFMILLIPNKVGPSGTKFRITDPMAFELETEICIDSEKRRVKPPGKYLNHPEWEDNKGHAHILGFLRSLVPAFWKVPTWMRAGRAFDSKRAIWDRN